MVRFVLGSLKVFTIVLVVAVVAAGGQWGFNYAMDRVADPDVGKPVSITINGDDDSDLIAERLQEAGLIRSEVYFSTQLRLTSGEIRPDTYVLRHGMSVSQIIDRITVDSESDGEEDVRAIEATEAARVVAQATILEGWRIEQIAEEYDNAGLRGGSEAFMTATTADYSRRFEFLQEVPSGASLEGYLFPNTYTISGATGSEDAVFQMLEQFDEQFSPDMRRRADEMGLTMHQVVTIASIVEREAAVAAERPIVAAVYLNRLEIGMKLDADPTVQYVLGDEDDWWPTLGPGDTTRPEADNPYNTYLYETIPPGPICNPGKASILAVLYPDDNDYIFFVAKMDGSGEHVFTADYDEHLRNIDTYLNN